MKEKSCGIVLYRDGGRRLYLLLHYPAGHWDFPKGHVEKGEDELATAVRELMEETGIKNIKIDDGFRERIEYSYKRNGEFRHKEVVFFLAQTEEMNVKISHEHIGAGWFEYTQSYKQLTYETSRRVLKKAEEKLNRL
ncbi:MAG: bis(5'-nucleosyl)-tetraphosphatase [Candidatus Anstonellales archaeon]